MSQATLTEGPLAHGAMMLTGKDGAAVSGRADPLGEESCSQRSAEALMYHAALAARGHGRPQSFDDALKYLSEAAALGDTRAKVSSWRWAASSTPTCGSAHRG